MKFVLASYGTRGDVEPYIAVGRELLHRGHGTVQRIAMAGRPAGPDVAITADGLRGKSRLTVIPASYQRCS